MLHHSVLFTVTCDKALITLFFLLELNFYCGILDPRGPRGKLQGLNQTPPPLYHIALRKIQLTLPDPPYMLLKPHL